MKIRLIKVNANTNNNKFWYADIDGCKVVRKWGRVGSNGQEKTFVYHSEQTAISETQKAANSKRGKGYTDLNLADDKQSTVVNLEAIALRDIETDAPDLISYFAKTNIHAITTNTNIKIVDGQLKTPLGVINSYGISQARMVLDKIALEYQQPSMCFDDLVNQYLMLIPTNVGRKLELQTLFNSQNKLQQQYNLLDAMASYTTITQSDNVFDTKLKRVTHYSALRKIEALYTGSANRLHKSYGMKIANVYSVHVKPLSKKFRREIGNVKNLWHGTKASNILSILKDGLKIVPSRAGFVTGRMFGDGLYFSDQSTKALNYATNFWGGRDEGRYFMFVCWVAMGKEFTPTDNRGYFPRTGYDSTFAKANYSNVKNNEMIVYNENQHNITYLVEFKK